MNPTLKPCSTQDDPLGDRKDWIVLKSMPLQPGFELSETSRYADNLWDLTPANFRGNAGRSRSKIDFTDIIDPTIDAAIRSYLYARLNVRIVGWAMPLPPTSARATFHEALEFFGFVASELGIYDATRVDQRMLDRYAKTQFAKRSSASHRAKYLKIVWHLFHYREYLAGHGITFEPWLGRSTAALCGTSSDYGENRTPRIPEPILLPLVAWSLKYIDVFSHDILAARDELNSLEARSAELASADKKLSRRDSSLIRARRVAVWLAERSISGRGVPIWTQQVNLHTRGGPEAKAVNWRLINTIAGADTEGDPASHVSLRPGTRCMVAHHMEAYGTEPGGLDTPISIDPETGRPWRTHFDQASLRQEERALQAACYIICAYLTGMRDSEVQAMRFGCLDLIRTEDGIVERYRVRSTAYKGRNKRGEPEAWITIEPTAKAIAVLERLSHSASKAYGVDTLWPVLNQGKATKTHIADEIVRQINQFRDHVNRLACDVASRGIPTSNDGTPFRITTRQFRRTLAWYIANRPFGTIAGMIQYKHASSAMFEGYAGASDSGFTVQVEQERRAGQMDDILEYFDSRQIGDTFGGPARARIERSLDAAADDLSPLPVRIADRSRLKTMLASLARTLHVGILADCFFDPTTALCLEAGPKANTPQMAMCRPTACPNACIRKRHLPAWTRALENVETHLQEKRLSAIQREAL